VVTAAFNEEVARTGEIDSPTFSFERSKFPDAAGLQASFSLRGATFSGDQVALEA